MRISILALLLLERRTPWDALQEFPSSTRRSNRSANRATGPAVRFAKAAWRKRVYSTPKSAAQKVLSWGMQEVEAQAPRGAFSDEKAREVPGAGIQVQTA